MSQSNLPTGWKLLPFIECLNKAKIEKRPSIAQEEYQNSGKYPIIDQGGNVIAGWTDSEECVISEGLPLIVFGDHTRIFKYIDFSFATGGRWNKTIASQP